MIEISIKNIILPLQKTLKGLFPSWEAVQRHREVVLFVVGLMNDPRPLVQHVYEMQVEDYLNQIKTDYGPYLPPIDDDLFKSFQTETSIPLPHPLHNEYINYYDHWWDNKKGRQRDTAKVCIPSKLYVFKNLQEMFVRDIEQSEGNIEVPDCAIVIERPAAELTESLLTVCSRIYRRQAVKTLHMVGVKCKYFSALGASIKMSKNAQSVVLYRCESLPSCFVKSILRQLIKSHCGDSFQRLELNELDLAPFQSLIDELLEDLVAHHQRKRKADLAQMNLSLRLKEFGSTRTNLSQSFIWKWRERCRGINSIDCEIDRSDSRTKMERFCIELSIHCASSYCPRWEENVRRMFEM